MLAMPLGCVTDLGVVVDESAAALIFAQRIGSEPERPEGPKVFKGHGAQFVEHGMALTRAATYLGRRAYTRKMNGNQG